MAFTIKPGKETLIVLSGKLDTRGAPPLMEELDALSGQDVDVILFDCSEMTYLSSAGIRAIIFARENIREGIAVQMKNVSDSVMEVISMVGLDEFVELI